MVSSDAMCFREFEAFTVHKGRRHEDSQIHLIRINWRAKILATLKNKPMKNRIWNVCMAVIFYQILQGLWGETWVLRNISQKIKVTGAQNKYLLTLSTIFWPPMTFQVFRATRFTMQKFSAKLIVHGLCNWNLHDIDYIYSCNRFVKFRHGLQTNLFYKGTWRTERLEYWSKWS